MELTLNVNDKVRLFTRSYLAPHHEQIVYLLYQPIIGPKAVNLYMTLWSLIHIDRKQLTMSHRQLFTLFGVDVNEFEMVRGRLEGIDLINVHYHPEEGYYIYELRQPLTGHQFFVDSNLNVHLLYQVGHDLYEYLKGKFKTHPLAKGVRNITKPFNEVYPEYASTPRMEDDEVSYPSNTHSQFQAPLTYAFDYELFIALLNKSFVHTDVLDERVKREIINEAALYQFDAQMMSKIVLDCVDKHGIIDFEAMHEVASQYYRRLGVKKSNEPIKASMGEKEFFEQQKESDKPEEEARAMALFNYKTKTPHEWLKMLQGKTEIPNSYLEVVRMLQKEYRLPSEVINVLVEFVRNRTDGQLPKEYARAVASSWVFKKIKTAEQAMEQVDKIVQAEEALIDKGEKLPTVVYRGGRRGHVERKPEWFERHEEYRKNAKDVQEEVDVDALVNLLGSFK